MAVDPVASIGLGLTWLGEQVTAGTLALVVEVFALACMVAGVAFLAREVPAISREPNRAHLRHGLVAG